MNEKGQKNGQKSAFFGRLAAVLKVREQKCKFIEVLQ